MLDRHQLKRWRFPPSYFPIFSLLSAVRQMAAAHFPRLCLDEAEVAAAMKTW